MNRHHCRTKIQLLLYQAQSMLLPRSQCKAHHRKTLRRIALGLKSPSFNMIPLQDLLLHHASFTEIHLSLKFV